MNHYRTTAVILAAGSGSRMNSKLTKQRMTILGKTVIERTVEAFQICDDIDSIVLVARADEISFIESVTKCFDKVICVVEGGNTRAESARIGFDSIPDGIDFVAIHDGARCLITPQMISDVISDARRYGAATAATLSTDTVKVIDSDGFVALTPERSKVMLATTPQVFGVEIYRKALESAVRLDSTITDDNMIVENAGFKVYCTDIGRQNLKITHIDDIDYAEFILKRRER